MAIAPACKARAERSRRSRVCQAPVSRPRGQPPLLALVGTGGTGSDGTKGFPILRPFQQPFRGGPREDRQAQNRCGFGRLGLEYAWDSTTAGHTAGSGSWAAWSSARSRLAFRRSPSAQRLAHLALDRVQTRSFLGEVAPDDRQLFVEPA